MEMDYQELQDQLARIERNSLLSAKKMLCFEDVAMLTGLSRSYLYKLTSTRQIPCYRPTGKLLYFDRGEVEAWMKQNRQGTIREARQEASTYIATNNR